MYQEGSESYDSCNNKRSLSKHPQKDVTAGSRFNNLQFERNKLTVELSCPLRYTCVQKTAPNHNNNVYISFFPPENSISLAVIMKIFYHIAASNIYHSLLCCLNHQHPAGLKPAKAPVPIWLY